MRAIEGNAGDNAGVVDPTKVFRCALQNAASISRLLLTTEAVATNFLRRNKGGGMSGMDY